MDRYASRKAIRKAWRTLSREIHPDKSDKAGRAEAQKRFELATQAFDTIVDPDKRKIYDTFGNQIITSSFEYKLSVKKGLIAQASDWYDDMPEIHKLTLTNIDSVIGTQTGKVLLTTSDLDLRHFVCYWHNEALKSSLFEKARALIGREGFRGANQNTECICDSQ